MKGKKSLFHKRNFFAAALAALMLIISGNAYAAESSTEYAAECDTYNVVYENNDSSDSQTTYAILEYSGEDTECFSIPITDPISRGIYHLDVSLTGDDVNHTVSATVKNDFAIWFSTVDITIELVSQRSGSPVVRAKAHDDDLNLGESLTVTHYGVTESAKYYAYVHGTGNGEKISYTTYSIPFNNKGKKYPTQITSPVTGESLPYNFSMTMSKVPESQRVKWTSTERKNYADRNGYDLTGTEVHHIRPREYGGTNDDWNLIPLNPDDHRKIVSPWWVNY